ncbi:glycosyltransferase family 39 protein [Sporomusa sp.]|uniref:glycosyltransferase family 39 protein n=1 Tax=Sporomusa sp. TaxID=2078658 RepID=UPI002D7F5E1D|nr:glycosyltransferase family 39 protein [Sporomusa sp.]
MLAQFMMYSEHKLFESATRSDKSWQIGYSGLLIFGLLFFVSCAFYRDMWFDEAYTVAMIRHDFFRICEITARDVHPPLYYIIAKLASLIWGQDIVVYRLVSVSGMMLFMLLGVSHIRKIFGNSVGFYYTFFTVFLPIMLEYSGEARMYAWAMFFTTSAGIYAYLSYKQNQNQRWALFVVFSLLSAYTHNYALLGAFFINLSLVTAVIVRKRYLLKPCLLAILVQVVFYLPWLFALIGQVISVTKEYWIVINYQHLLRDLLVFYFAENLPGHAVKLLSFIWLAVCGFGLYAAVKQKKQHFVLALVSLFIYLAVIGLALVLSLVKPIFITRYLMPNSGFLLIALAFGLASFKRQIVPLLLCSAILIAAFVNFYLHYDKIYSPLNHSLRNDIVYSLKPDDIFLYTDIHPAGIYSVAFPDNQHYVFLKGGQEEAKPNPFQPELTIIYDLNVLKEYKGRLWLIESANSQILYGHLGKNDNLFTVIDYARTYEMPYLARKGFVFVGSLLQKEPGQVPELTDSE